MAQRRVIVSPQARKDIGAIRKHSERQWGSRKTDIYIDALWDSIDSLATYPDVGRAVSTDQPEHRRLVVARHVVYYRVTESSIEVSRILHERMDATGQLGQIHTPT